MKSFFLLSAMLLLAVNTLVAESTKELAAATVMFENYETVFHSNPVLVSGVGREVEVGFVSQSFGYLAVALGAVSTTFKSDILTSSDGVLLGTKDYRIPDGLGRVKATRCYIVILRNGSTFSISRYFKNTTLVKDSAGPIYEWSADLQEFGDRRPLPSSLYAKQVGHEYILITNDLDEVRVISTQLINPEGNSVLAKLHEWNDLRRHAFWGYRKYRHGLGTAVDPTFAGTDGVSEDADALIVYIDSNEMLVVRLFSPNSRDATAVKLSRLYKIVPFKTVRPGVWETRFSLSNSQPFPESPDLILWLFGLGVAV